MRRASLARLCLLALLWGSSFLWIDVALAGLSPAQITLVRLILGAAVLLLVVRARRLPLPRGRRLWGHLAVAALLANALPYTLFGVGQQTVDSGLAGALNATTPLWTAAVALAWGHQDRLTRRRVIGLAIGFAGAVVILAPWTGSADASWAGSLACLAASASYGVSYVYMSRYLTGRGVPPLVLAATQLAIAAAIMVIVLPLGGAQPLSLSPAVVAAVGILGALGTGVAYILNYRLIADEGPTSASAVTYLLPVVAVTLGVMVLSEPLTVTTVTGSATVLTGVALIQTDRSRARTAT